MLKVVHISAYDNGGAGNAAMRLHLGLLSIGVHSTFLCIRKTTDYKNVVQFRQGKRSILQSPYVRAPFNKIGLPIDKITRNAKKLNKLTGKYEMFTFPDAEGDILSHPAVMNADIINLHWVANLLDYSSFFTNVNKPVVWTMHDMNPIQGGFHYADDVELNKTQFGAIEDLLRKKKSELINTCKNLSVVAPSKWLHNLAKKSDAFKSASHFCIPYGLDTGLFKDFGKAVSRPVFDLPMDKIIFSFVSHDIHNRRKGFDLLYDAIKQMKNLEQVIFCAVGCATEEFHDDRFIYLGNIRDEKLMALLYSASDAYVLPSREDNFPNVMLEAMCCGTPVLSFAVGGMPDLIQPGFNGELANEASSTLLAACLDLFVSNVKKFDRGQIRHHIVEHYNLSVQANNYLDLYHAIQQ